MLRIPRTAACAPDIVVITGILYFIAERPISYSSYLDCAPKGVFTTNCTLPFLIASVMFGRPSPTLKVV